MKWETLRYSKSMFCSVENVVYIAASMVGEEGKLSIISRIAEGMLSLRQSC